MSQTAVFPVLLVVDDDRDIRNLLSEHLEQHGFRTVKAADGRAMRAALEAGPVDLVVLVRNGGRPLSRERIRALSTVADADDRAIDLRVSRLRQKLGDDARNPALIRTVRSLGYMLSGPVTWRA